MSARIKGASLINTIAILREVLGAQRFQSVVDTCPQATQQLIRRTLIAVEWIPLEQWAPFIQAIFEQICRKDETQFRRLLRAVCKRDFSTIYRSFLAQASPHAVLNKASNIWSSYFDSGTLTIDGAQVENGSAPVTLLMRDFETDFPLYAVTMQAYLEQLMVMAGAEKCTVQRSKLQVREGKLSCDYIVNLGR